MTKRNKLKLNGRVSGFKLQIVVRSDMEVNRNKMATCGYKMGVWMGKLTQSIGIHALAKVSIFLGQTVDQNREWFTKAQWKKTNCY